MNNEVSINVIFQSRKSRIEEVQNAIKKIEKALSYCKQQIFKFYEDCDYESFLYWKRAYFLTFNSLFPYLRDLEELTNNS